MLYILTCLAGDGVDPDLVHTLAEELPVLGIHNGLDGGPKDLYVIVSEHPFLVEGDTTVECSLSTE